MEDHVLVQQFQQGKHDVFEILVERYKKRLYAFAFKLVQNHHDAEDLSQETFLRAYTSLDQFRGEGSFISWLFTITVNTYRSLKRKKSFKIVDMEVEEVMQVPTKENDVTHNFSNELQALTKTAIEKLPPKQKLILILRTFEQLSYQEIAQITGISQESVKANLSYARQNLRNQLQELMQ